jgi:hypothetical protein
MTKKIVSMRVLPSWENLEHVLGMINAGLVSHPFDKNHPAKIMDRTLRPAGG